MRIVPASEVPSDCGAPGQDILACYIAGVRRMIVPGDMHSSGGVTTSFVIAHEYGHHVAAYRSNAPFSALDFGPKRWSSYERVCARTLAGKLFPGDEGNHYVANPGEAWAETYAHLVYPKVHWFYTRLLKPDAGALAAARADVLDPWTGPATKRFAGTLAERRGEAELPAEGQPRRRARASSWRGRRARSTTCGCARTAARSRTRRPRAATTSSRCARPAARRAGRRR